MHKIIVLLTCEPAVCCKMHVHMCIGVRLCVFCGCQTGERGLKVLSRRPSAPELTCVPINTAATLLTCSPVGPSSLAEHTEIQQRATLGREGAGGGSKENERERETT